MPLNFESLDAIKNRIATDMEHGYDKAGIVVDARTPGTGLTEIVNARAGESYNHQQQIKWLAAQLLVDTMDDDILLQRAAEKGITRNPGTPAAGTAVVTGNDGVAIAKGTTLEATNGIQFVVTNNAVIAGGSAVITLTATVIGSAGNLQAGTPLVFLQPIIGAHTAAKIIGNGLAAGADIEPLTRVRSRFKTRLQQTPMGGKLADYVEWALEAHVDVTRAWATAHEGSIGRMVVRFVTEDLQTPIPTPQHRLAVETYMQTQIPAGLGSFDVEAPVARPLNPVFISLSPNTPTVQAAITAELNDLLRHSAKTGTTLPLSHIRAAISNAPGEFDFTLDMNEDLALAANQFPTLGVPQWP